MIANVFLTLSTAVQEKRNFITLFVAFFFVYFITTTGTPPNCECPAQYELDDIHWICRPWYLKPTTTTYRPIVTHKPVQVRCPQNSLNPEEYVPFCRFNITVSQQKRKIHKAHIIHISTSNYQNSFSSHLI